MIRTIAILGSLVLAIASSSGIAAEKAPSEPGPYPIWLSPYSPVKSLGDVEDAWTRPFLEGEEGRESRYHKWKFTKGEGQDKETVFAEDCKTIFELEKQGYKTDPWHGRRFYDEQRRGCDFIVLMRKARPAKQSFIQAFELNEAALGVLPAFLRIGASCQGACQSRRANERGVPLSAYKKFAAVRSDGRFRLTLARQISAELAALGLKVSPRGESDIVLLGRADFTGDGVEDLAVRASAWSPPPARWRNTEVFVLTRRLPDAVLRVESPDQYPCPRYTCQTEYPWVDEKPAGPQ